MRKWKVSRRWGWSFRDVAIGVLKGWFVFVRFRVRFILFGFFFKVLFIKEWVEGVFVRYFFGFVGFLCLVFFWYFGFLLGEYMR